MKHAVLTILVLCISNCCALCQGHAPRLVAAVTIMTYRDSAGNEFSYIADSLHYGYKNNDEAPVKLLGALDGVEKYGQIKMYNPADGGRNYGLRNVVPAWCDTIITFHTVRRTGFYGPNWGNEPCEPNPYSIIINEHDAHNNLVAMKLFQQNIGCTYNPELYLWLQKSFGYDSRNNCTSASDTSYLLGVTPQSIFETNIQQCTYDDANNRISEFDSAAEGSEQTSPAPYTVRRIHNTFDSAGRLAHTETNETFWQRGTPYPSSTSIGYSYSENGGSEAINAVWSNSRRPAESTYSYAYNYANGKLASVKCQGAFETIEYDAHGRLIKETNPEEYDQKWEWQYNDAGLPALFTKPEASTDFVIPCPNGRGPVSQTITRRYYYQ